MKKYFLYKGKQYFVGTIIKIHPEMRDKFNFYAMLRFIKYDSISQLCYFTSLYDSWKSYIIPEKQLNKYIEAIVHSGDLVDDTMYCQNNNPNYIEGIVDAWIWYIISMLFSCMLNGFHNVICAWILASIIFFSWRRKKIKRR